MFNAMGSSNPQDLGNGGTIDGDIVITGDLQVDGGGSLSFDEIIEGTQVIDVTNTEALLVRKNSDGGDIFTVDTTNSEVELGVDVKLKIKTSGYSGQLSINSSGYTELQALGDRSIDLKSQRQIRMFTSADGASYTQALNLSSTGGNATFLGTVTVGADGSGKDVTFYSATAGDSFAWDASEEKLTITGTDGALALDIADGYVKVQESLSITNGSGSFYVWSDDPFGSNYEVLRIDKPSGANARLSVYKGGTGTYRGLSIETGSSAEGIIIDSSSNVAIANNLDVDGTTNLDAVDIDGAVQIDSTVTVGVDDTGQDVKFFGATSGKYMLWDESGDDLIVSGAIGINGTPTADLHVFGQTVRIAHDTPELVLQDTSSYSAGTGPGLYFQGNESDGTLETFGEIHGVSVGNNTGSLLFKTRNGSSAQRMRIDENGAVQIGSTDASTPLPAAGKLAIYEASGAYIFLQNSTTGTGSEGISLQAYQDDGYIVNYSDTNGNIAFYVNNGSDVAMTVKGTKDVEFASNITAAGVVDITDTTDASDDSGDTGALRVEGGASIAKKLYVGGSVSLENGLDVSAVTTLKYETNSMTLTRDGGHLMVLRNSGSAIADGEALGYYRFNGKVGSSDEEVGVSIQAEADGAWTNDTDCPARLEIHTNSGSSVTERMRIDKDGVVTLGLNDATATSVGIGASPSVTANTSILHIGNHNTAVAVIYLTDNEAQDDFFIQSNSELRMGYNNTTYHSMSTTGVAKWTSNTNSNLSIDTASATSEPRIVAINDAETAYVTLGLYAEPLELKRGQIKFPATQVASSDANTLDDFEQGTHTATITPSTSGTVTLSSSYTTISYTKIGDIVHIGGNLVIGSVSSPVGTYVRISSPFTNNNGHQTSPRWNGSGRRWNGSAWSEVWTTTTENVAGIDVVLDASTLAANHQIRFGITFKATS